MLHAFQMFHLLRVVLLFRLGADVALQASLSSVLHRCMVRQKPGKCVLSLSLLSPFPVPFLSPFCLFAVSFPCLLSVSLLSLSHASLSSCLFSPCRCLLGVCLSPFGVVVSLLLSVSLVRSLMSAACVSGCCCCWYLGVSFCCISLGCACICCCCCWRCCSCARCACVTTRAN